MTSEAELFGKDSVKLNILKELLSGDINISLSLDGSAYKDYISQIHRNGSRMQILGKFNISEDPSGEILTFRPIMVSGILKITFGFSGNAFENEKKLSIFRSSTKTIESKFDIKDNLISVEFIPQGNIKYILRLTYRESEQNTGSAQPADSHDNLRLHQNPPTHHSSFVQSLDDFDEPAASSEAQPERASFSQNTPVIAHNSYASGVESDSELDEIQNKIRASEDKLKRLRERKASAKDILKKLQAEYDKDYDEFRKELEEYRQQFQIDQSVIDYYRDNDIRPIEDLIKEISEKLDSAEKQIGVVILSRQQKTMEIENEVKSNKRQ